MPQIKIGSASKLVEGHVLDVAKKPLLRALRRYDPQLYVKWNPKKNRGRGTWELRRKPETKHARPGRMLETPNGKVLIPGNIYEWGNVTLISPRYIETSFENHVKDFDYLTYDMVAWLESHDLWKFGHRGKLAMHEAEYKEAKFDEKIDSDSYDEKQYMIKQHRTQFEDFREYVLSGQDPYRLMEYWDKV